jgi:5-(carboxyamino)imidazole ribonucleotide synthase
MIRPPVPTGPLPPGSSLGVLGGGQLGRLFVQAAQRLGYVTVVLDPDPASPAGAVAHRHIAARYDDLAALDALAEACDAVTLEFENVPADAVGRLAACRPVAPSAAALAVCQDRVREKRHFGGCGVACAPHAVIEREADLAAVPDALLPGILKTARLGYDGKGQRTVSDRAALADAFTALGGVTCVLEQRLALACELSVVVARDAAGAWVHLPVFANWHRDGILAVTEAPARGVPQATLDAAVESAGRVAASLDYVGVLCVEFFVLDDGRLLANEMAPRPHNSGHLSVDACDLSQFDLQVRTLAGLPLVAPRQHAPAVMLNLLGDLWFPGRPADPPVEPDWPGVLALPGVALHLYGKAEPRPGRKMGHLTVTAADAEQVRAVATQAARRLGLPPP